MTKHSIASTLILAALVANNNFAFADDDDNNNRWNTENDPHQVISNLETKWDNLPLDGKVNTTKRGWSDFYWSQDKGGIAYRYQSDSKFSDDKSPSLTGLTSTQANVLSPAEKADIVLGDYSYSITTSERKRNSSHAPDWRGLCHGWSPSANQYDEPQTTTVKGKTNVQVTFYTDDIKALLAYYMGQVSDGKVVQVGKRCNLQRAFAFFEKEACDDINPASMHLIFANLIGIKHTGLQGDLERYKQVWNYPIVGYHVEVQSMTQAGQVSNKATPGTAKEIDVETTITYAGAIDPTIGTVLDKPAITDDSNIDGPVHSQLWQTAVYDYTLELDYYNHVIGGRWDDGSDRPDFLWTIEHKTPNPQSGDKATASFGRLFQLLGLN